VAFASALAGSFLAGSLFAGFTSDLAGALAAGLASSFLAAGAWAKADTANIAATIAITDFILNFL
jgi:hypothetical protein